MEGLAKQQYLVNNLGTGWLSYEDAANSNSMLNGLAQSAAYDRLVKSDAPLEDISVEMFSPIAGSMASKVGVAVHNIGSQGLANTVVPVDQSRRMFIKSAPAAIMAVPAAISGLETAGKTLAKQGAIKMAKKGADNVVGKEIMAKNIANTHRIGLSPDFDKLLLAKKQYTKDTYGIPTVEVGRYKKLLDEDVALGKISREAADAKISNVKNTTKSHMKQIQDDKILSKFSDDIEDLRREYVGAGTQADNAVNALEEFIIPGK